MSILKFQQTEEPCECPTCDLAEKFMELILQSNTVDELEFFVRQLIDEATDLGFKEALVNDINRKIELLEVLDGERDCCEECCNEDCES